MGFRFGCGCRVWGLVFSCGFRVEVWDLEFRASGSSSESADLGGRVGWLPKVGGRVGGVSRLRFPPGPHLRSSCFSRHPRLRQAPTTRFAKNREVGGFCGEKAPGPWWAGPQAPWRPGLTGRFTSCKPSF